MLFIFNRKNELFRISAKLAFLPTFGLPVAKNCLPHARQDVLAGTVTEWRLEQPIIPYRGAISDAISDRVGKKNSQP